MAIEHSVVTDPHIHEPRGASSAPAGTAYVADGNGSGTWSTVATPATVQTQFAEMDIHQGTSALALSAAVDPTLNTGSDYVKYSPDWQAGLSQGTAIQFSGNKLDVTEDGLYMLNAWASIRTDTGTNTNKRLAIKVSSDDTVPGLGNGKAVFLADFSGDVHNITASGVFLLSAGQSVSVWIAAEDAVNAAVEEAKITLVRML